MENYFISVIVPVYNMEQYLEQCVMSLVGQTLPASEILLVDDGSKDASPALCDGYAEKYPNVKAFHKENGGLISAWMYGVGQSRGEYLCFVDSDDWVEPDMLETMAACLSGRDREMVISDYVIERDNGKKEYVYQKLEPGVYEREQIEQKIIPVLLGREERLITVSRCMKLISRRLLEENLHYLNPDIRMGEDLSIMFPALLDCEKLTALDRKAFYHYRHITDSMAHHYDKTLVQNNEALMAVLRQVICDKFAGKEAKKEQMLLQADKEEILLGFLILKNEVRGNAGHYRENVIAYCKRPENRKRIREVKISVSGKANKLLYLVMRHPNPVTCRLLKLAMCIYDR